MPRKQLIRTSESPYHVTIRCNNREWFDLPLKLAWNICLRSMSDSQKKKPVLVHAFVLMNNHYHLLLTTPNADLDHFMFYFNTNISKQIRFHTGRINRIFGDRYKWSLIQDSRYLETALRYIYQNPLSAEIVNRCEDYPFSTLHYLTKGLPLPFEVDEPLFKNSAKHLEFLNQKQEDRETLTKAMSRPIFKWPAVSSSRRKVS